ncbi:N-acetylglutamate synthase-like GNAT family acetyltransferase [Tenacibaculum sp. 190130A14a]|uniref:N-acetylglutamate synthase-like GNAT family acetyltransferase n=1 Tax=Tenacibaculum polynesiense TaxID=3137857 RepID=A0ABM9PBC4_9FLAO
MIRAFTKEDKESLLKLLDLNTPQYFDSSEKEDFIDYLENQTEDYFVVIEQNQIIGCGGINYFNNQKEARISWDMIHPEFHGKGVGKKLMNHRLHVINNHKNIDHIVVRTSQFVHLFYEKMGFKLQRIEKDFWAKGIDMYFMTKENSI